MTTPNSPATRPRTSYDDVPYLSRSHQRTHPDRLATVATLLGMQPPPVTRCRVLELGCANGGNLMPMAELLPESEFVGIDLSGRQIADGLAAVRELGLHNLSLRQCSILDVDDSFGVFDYIIVHGVYSWVPPEVQDKILAICQRNLAENGVAYVSYNTLPGWYSKLRVRDMMIHHVRGIADPHTRLRRAREFVYGLADLLVPPGTEQPMSVHAAEVRAEADIIRAQDDDYIFHEYLEDDNTPIYFTEFVERAERHGLQYLGDADRGLRALDSYGAEVAQALRQLSGGVVAQEQYLDYISNRTFRCTLLCHAGVGINRAMPPARLRGLWVRSRLRPASDEPDLIGATAETFQAEDSHLSLTVAHPVSKVALALLHEAWPRAIEFDTLLDMACARAFAGHELAASKVARAREADPLATNLLQAHVHDGEVVSVHTAPPAVTTQPGQRPLASRVARYEALLAQVVTNAYHQQVRLGNLSWYLLPFLDGTHDHAALAELVVGNQTLALQKDGQEVLDPAAKRQLADEQVAETLHNLAQQALLLEEA